MAEQIEINMETLKSLFSNSTQNKDVAFKYIEENFTNPKATNLVPLLVDFYMNTDFNLNNDLYKPFIELLSKVPDVQLSKIFDKLNEFCKNSHKIDRIMRLLVSLAYNTKGRPKWCKSLLPHQLFLNLIRLLSTKANTANEFITTQTCSLFVIIMENGQPNQIGNDNQQTMFQIVLNLYKSLISSDYKKYVSNNDSNSAKWSIKLFFYAFYGLMPHLFVQCLRKKENQIINKEALNSILCHLRMHPALLKEKAENNDNISSHSNEWSQYCLDKNYSNLNHLTFENCLNEATNSRQTTSFQRQGSSNAEPLSPLFKLLSERQMSTTSIHQQFNFPSNEALNNNLQEQLTSDKVVKNLTAQFIQDDQNLVKNFQLQPFDESIKKKIDEKKSNGRCSVYFPNDFKSISSQLSKKKSLSESNLVNHQSYERRRKAKTAIFGNNTIYTDENENNKKVVRSEMRDPTIIRDPSLFLNNNQLTNDFDSFSKTNEISVLSLYLSRASNLTDSSLKIEYETLCHELFYERYLREKYEDYFNKGCALKAENEQLSQEKFQLEECLASAIESQTSLKLIADEKLLEQFRKLTEEIEEKRKEFDLFKKKEIEMEMINRDLQQELDDLKSSFIKLEKKLDSTLQELDKEKNINRQHQNETVYIKTLRNTNDDLRRKLLIMNKYTRGLAMNSNTLNTIKNNQIFNTLRDEIQELNKQIEELKNDNYLSIEAQYREKDEKNKELLMDKNKQIDDLNQQITSTISQFSADLYKKNSNIYKSIFSANGRLETEIIKLKAEICQLKNQLEQQK